MTDAVVIAAAPDLRVWSAPLLAFIAGVASFASPCVFPLVPGYIAFVVGGRGATAAPTGDRRRHVLPIVLFILGFSTIFVVLGAASATWVPLVRGRSGQVLAGGYICLVGLTMLATARGRAPGRSAPCRSEWRLRPAGHRASDRSSARYSPSPRWVAQPEP